MQNLYLFPVKTLLQTKIEELRFNLTTKHLHENVIQGSGRKLKDDGLTRCPF